MLTEPDRDYLATRWPDHQVLQDGGGVAVILRAFLLPAAFSPATVDLLLRLPFGFPDTQPDMFWVYPHVLLRGVPPVAASVIEHMHGLAWQRFSRHLPAGVWRPGIDNLQSYVALITTMLEREAGVSRRAA